MVAERVEYQLSLANVSGGECEASWKNDFGNNRTENFSTVNNTLRFSMSLIAGVKSFYDTHLDVKNMLGKVKGELDNLYDFMHMKDLHPYPWQPQLNRSFSREHFSVWKCCVVWLRFFMRNIHVLIKNPPARARKKIQKGTEKIPGWLISPVARTPVWPDILKVQMFALVDSKTWTNHWIFRSASLNFTGLFKLILKAKGPARKGLVGSSLAWKRQEGHYRIYLVDLILFRMKC